MNNNLTIGHCQKKTQGIAAIILAALLLPGCSYIPTHGGLYQPTPWVLEQNRTRLVTIQSLLQSGQTQEAKNNADSINPMDLSPEQKAQFSLLYGEIMLSMGDAEQAVYKFAQVQPQALSLQDQTRFYRSSAQAYNAVGNFLKGANALIELDMLLTSSIEHYKNHAAIFESLSLLPDNVLAANQTQAMTPYTEWLELAHLLKDKNQSPSRLNALIMQWRVNYPSHPANASFLQNLQKSLADVTSRPRSIALFLPESGVYAEAGKAVKAGIMAAYNHENGEASRPMLRFYDSEIMSGTEMYNQAVSQQADLIIGPLDKDKIQSLVSSSHFNIPVLALNHVQGLRKNNLYQFGLSPMDDADQITSKARLDGHKNAFLLTPDNEQGKRVASFLESSWENKGGRVLQKKAYNPDQSDFSFISKRLNIQSGRKQKYTDNTIDTLLLSAYDDKAKLVNSAVRLSSTHKVGIYAMPTVYSGRPNSISDAMLNNVSFCDAPWLFNMAYTGDLNMQALQSVWGQFNNQYYRLIAMGIDAYALANQLKNLGMTPYYGATGKLSLAENNRIKRQLICAQFINGQPQLRGFLVESR